MAKNDDALDGALLDKLYRVIQERRDADPGESHTARLFEKGLPKIAQKVGEEAVETLIEGLGGDRAKLAQESADLLYHLLVLWAACGLEPEEVWRVLGAREGVSGLAEKADRKNS